MRSLDFYFRTRSQGHCIITRWKSFFVAQKSYLKYSYIQSSGAFLALPNVEGNSISLLQGFETLRIDVRMVDKYIRAIFLLNEPKPFFVVEPFHCALSHGKIPPFWCFNGSSNIANEHGKQGESWLSNNWWDGIDAVHGGRRTQLQN